MRLLKARDIDCAYIASGFFSDFTARLAKTAPDFAINEEMQGKNLFLLGGYDEDSTKLCELRDSLIKHGIKAHASKLVPTGKGEDPMRWHAKIAVFFSESRPVLAIVGSSNFTAPTMHGGSEHIFIDSPNLVQVEADSFYWRKSHMNTDQAVHDAFNYWGGGKIAPHISFNEEKFDDEIETLIQKAYSNLQSFNWEAL